MSSTYPSTAGEALQTKLLGDLGGAHGVLESRHQYPVSNRNRM